MEDDPAPFHSNRGDFFRFQACKFFGKWSLFRVKLTAKACENKLMEDDPASLWGLPFVSGARWCELLVSGRVHSR